MAKGFNVDPRGFIRRSGPVKRLKAAIRKEAAIGATKAVAPIVMLGIAVSVVLFLMSMKGRR